MTIRDLGIQSGKVISIALGASLRQPDAFEFLLNHTRSVRYRDAILVEQEMGEAWVFDYGVVVFWGVPEEERRGLLARLEPFIEQPLETPPEDQMRFELGAERDRVHQDAIYLQGDEPLQLLAVSHALAQSAKLDVFETRARQTIAENEALPRALAETGRMPLRSREIAKRRGALFTAKSDIVLNYNLLDTPEFFWDYPETEPLYEMLSRYLEIVQRVQLLSHKLETIHEMLEMLAEERRHQHSSFLEIVIILLIALEIVMAFLGVFG